MKGRIIQIKGGIIAAKRLEVLGVRPGKDIIKINAHFWRGPITVKVNSSVVAIGHGIASKVLVEV